ncbi:hypothetical protein JZO70_04390 [Enterococcus sp. 669A]|uniref:Alternate signal-mediated exported protein n=2 Tax=Candidatus Enterococcus moelleringii TaxID=2815325 RepID=A0ABS3L6Y5_9ENTE|nr:hypothetical protein [Enterococcus sp. 669A]MBO1305384.1 hypothetical protein [Enterococcus sp. 669A]
MRRKSAHRRLFLAITLACLLLMVGGGYLVYAAMTATDRVENDFQIGQVETKIEEAFDGSITEISKNVSVPKKVSIKNTGTIKQFVRVMVLPEVRTTVAGDPSSKQILPLNIGSDLTLENMNTDEWIDGGDGYYYYVKEAVPANKPTSSLFESIKLSEDLSNQYHNANLSITLKVEAINCSEFAYRQAWWQGTEPADGPLKTIDDALRTKTET